jgi:hypothetical protein
VRSAEDEGPPLGLEAAAIDAAVWPVAEGLSAAHGPVEPSGSAIALNENAIAHAASKRKIVLVTGKVPFTVKSQADPFRDPAPMFEQNAFRKMHCGSRVLKFRHRSERCRCLAEGDRNDYPCIDPSS